MCLQELKLSPPNLFKNNQGSFKLESLKQLARPNLEIQMRMNADKGWLGMFASLDYMHYCWKKCPIAWQGSFINKNGNKFIILEGIAN